MCNGIIKKKKKEEWCYKKVVLQRVLAKLFATGIKRCVCVRERESVRESERDRHTDTDTDRDEEERGRQRQRQRHCHRKTINSIKDRLCSQKTNVFTETVNLLYDVKLELDIQSKL